jgi:pimeloyl-ACP methyl ester carboxylesterase
MLKRLLAVRLLLPIGVALLAGTPQIGAAQTTYRIVEIGALPGDTQSVPHDINDAGEVVGISGSNKLFRWSQSQGMRNPGITVEAPFFFFRQPPTILRVNNQGTAVGPNFVQRLNKAPHYRANVCIPSCYVGIGFGGINDKDEVAVTSMTSNSYVSLIYKARENTYQLDAFNYLWPAYTYAYNNSRMIAGGMFDRRPGSGTGAKVEGFLANPLPVSITQDQTGFTSEAFDLNGSGETVGQDAGKPFYYSPISGHFYISTQSGIAHGINEAGQVVGAVGGRAFVWTKDTGLTYLDTTIDPRDPASGSARFSAARAINKLGYIVAINQGTGRAVLLVPAIEVVDAAPEFVSGTRTIAYSDAVATGGRAVEGVAADGAATLVLKIPVASEGQQVTVQHPDAPACHAGGIPGATAVDVCGGLGGLGTDPVASFYTATAVATPRGPMAFVVYRAPSDFAWSPEHKALAFRNLELKVLETGEPIKLTIVRPPVMYVHGLWDNSGSDSIIKANLQTDNRLAAYVADYGDEQEAIQVCRVVPSGAIADGTKVRGSALGIEYGAARTLEKIKAELIPYRKSANKAGLPIAAARFALVGHSMGALVSRYIQHLPGYKDNTNYGIGAIHKLISVAGPHLGSPFAKELLKNNSCIRGALRIFNKPPLHVIESYSRFEGSSCLSGVRLSGAIADLSGDASGLNVSPALSKLRGGGSIPVAFLTGAISARAVSALSANGPINDGDQLSQDMAYTHNGVRYLRKRMPLDELRSVCQFTDDLPSYLTAARYPAFMGGEADGIVAAKSANAGRSPFLFLNDIADLGTTGAAHSKSTASDLGFGVVDVTGGLSVKTMVGGEAGVAVTLLMDTPVIDPLFIKGQ